MNYDTVVGKDFLIGMVKVAESDEEIGIVGCNVYEYYNTNLLWGSAMYINKWLFGGKMKVDD